MQWNSECLYGVQSGVSLFLRGLRWVFPTCMHELSSYESTASVLRRRIEYRQMLMCERIRRYRILAVSV